MKNLLSFLGFDAATMTIRKEVIGGVGNHTTHTADPKAPTIHIVASNFLGGVDIKN